MKAIIFDIQRNSFVDGPGIRTTVFFKGCNLKCKWCHNPESQSPKPQILFYQEKCTGCGRCAGITEEDSDFICYQDAKQICGKEYTAREIFDVIKKDKMFYDTSNGGATFSGGECMLQIDFLVELLKMCKAGGIHTAVDTAGNVPWEYFEKILPYTDMFLYDVKAFSEDLHKQGTGVSNKLIFENLRRLSGKCDLIIRIPVIGGFNDDMDEMKRIASFLNDIEYQKIEPLPYHSMGEHKYNALGMDYERFTVPEMTEIKKIFEESTKHLLVREHHE